MSNYAFEGPKWSSSDITWSFATAGDPFSNAISDPAYQNTIRAALARWSQAANITFKQVADSSAADLRIGWARFTGTQVGETSYSYSTIAGAQTFLAGTKIRLEDPSARAIGTAPGDYYTGTTTTLYETALHELGHALGLAHSTDPNAVMYASIGPNDNDLNSSDITGIQSIYGAAAAILAPVTTPVVANLTPLVAAPILTAPLTTIPVATPPSAAPLVAPSPLPLAVATTGNIISVYRFFDTNNGTQFLTANSSERDTVVATRPDLTYEGLGLGALTTAGDTNTVPVYRFFDTRNGSHFFTTSASENAQIIATRKDLIPEQASFYEHATQAAGDIPVYRFFDGTTGTHFYTGDSGEKAQLQATRPDFTLEGIAFYAPTVSAANTATRTADAAAQASPQTIAMTGGMVLVHRFDGSEGRQLLTADRTEADAVLRAESGISPAGVMGGIAPEAGDDDAAPVFRFFSAATGDHFLTADATEAAQLTATRPDLVQEQTAFYEHLTAAADDVPVYRFFDTATGRHFYTASPSEHAAILASRPDMAQEGIAFYAPSIAPA